MRLSPRTGSWYYFAVKTIPSSDGLPDETGARCFVLAVSGSARAHRLVSRAAEFAADCPRWYAVHIETPTDAKMNSSEHANLSRNLNLAEQLGAQTVILPAVDPVAELLTFARRRGVARIVVGKPRHRWLWNSWIGRLSVAELTRRSGDIDIYVLSESVSRFDRTAPRVGPDLRSFLSYFFAIAIVCFATLVNLYVINPYFPLRNVTMIYLLGVIVTASRCGTGPSALATVLSVVLFDLAFVRRHGSFELLAPSNAITLCVMLAIGFIISTLTGHVRFQVQAARHREQRMSALFALGRELAKLRSPDEIAAAAEGHIGSALDVDASIWFPEKGDRPPGLCQGDDADTAVGDRALFEWVRRHNLAAGAGTATSPEVRARYLPLSAPHGCIGVVRLGLRNGRECLSSERLDLSQALTSLTALAIERAISVAAAQRARLEAESERLRNALLSAVSHDLRTPLAVIVGSSSTLVELGDQLDRKCQHELAESILDEGNRLNRQVANLLEMTRLENGSLQIRKEWQTLDEVAGLVLSRFDRPLHAFNVRVGLPPDLPPVLMDQQLIQQVLMNLLENAIKYAPAGTAIDLSARRDGDNVTIAVMDSGPGMPPEVLEHAFDRFYRGPAAEKTPGVGLGLSICQGIVRLHGGRIWAENRKAGGLAVYFSLPIPEVDREIADEVRAGSQDFQPEAS